MLNIFMIILLFNGVILTRIKASFFKVVLIVTQLKIFSNLYQSNLNEQTDAEVINLIKNVVEWFSL